MFCGSQVVVFAENNARQIGTILPGAVIEPRGLLAKPWQILSATGPGTVCYEDCLGPALPLVEFTLSIVNLNHASKPASQYGGRLSI